MKALLIRVSGKSEDIDWPLDLEAMQKYVGGMIQYVPRVSGSVMPLPDGKMATLHKCIVNEEGLLLGLERNVLASIFANDGDLDGPLKLVGDAIIVYTERDGERDISNLVDYMTRSMADLMIKKQKVKTIHIGGEEE